MKRVILTGGTGFVGANLARRLLQLGHEVHLLVRSGYTAWRIEGIRREVRLHEVNFASADMMDTVVGAIRPDWVFHLATHGAYSWQTDLRRILESNFTGTVNLVEATLKAGFETFVNTGSSSEYGFKDHAPTENEWLEPNSYYAVAKASATLYCRYSAQRHRVRLPTLRLYSVYGPYEEPNRLLPNLILNGLQNRLPPLVNPQTARDYIYVDDVLDAYLLAATQPLPEFGTVYNVGSGAQTTLREAVVVARETLGITAEPQWGAMPARQWDTGVWVSDNRKAQRELGSKPRYDFAQGFRAMVDWFRAHPDLQAFYERAAAA